MSSEVAESLREMASNLLAIANRLDGIDVSADAMRSGGRGVMVEVARDFMAELEQWSAPCQVKIVPDGRGGHTLIGRRDVERGGTVRVDNGDGTMTYQYNAVLSVPSGFAVGADRDGAVGMYCQLGGWCTWEYVPEDNELTTEQFAQQATAHVAEKHLPGA